MSLVELLVCVAVVCILLALLLPAVCRAANRARAWAWGVEIFWNARIDSVDNDAFFTIMSTSRPCVWSYVELRGTNIVALR